MALIDFDKSQYNAETKKQRQILQDLQKQNATRFNYPTSDDADLLKTLLPITWNNICFPIMKISTDIDHDIVQHKYPNRDGAVLESMGRNPLVIKVTAVFSNTINPGINEFWEKGTLYPNVYKQMLYESLASETQVLNHPFMGAIEAKIESFKPNIDAKIRGGEIVDITFIETITEQEIEYIFSIIDRASQAAIQIDTAFANLTPNPKDLGLPVYKKDLNDLLSDVKGAINQTDRVIKGAYSTAPIDELYGRCKEIVDATKRLNQSSNAFIKQTATILQSSATLLKNELKTNDRDIIKIIRTITPSTLSSYVSQTGNSMDELMYLNSALVKKVVISPNTDIRYYQK